jgi:hypothetical protein
MKFVDKFIRRLEISRHKHPAKAADDDDEFIRQQTPPDEREAERDEANQRKELVAEQDDPVDREPQSGVNTKTRAKKAGKS